MPRHRDRNQSTFTVVQALPGRLGIWQVWVGGDALPRAKRQVAALRAALPERQFWIQAAIRP